MAKSVVVITRFISIVAALAVTVAVVCFPRLVAIDMHAVPHGWLVCLLLGMSFAYVHGFGFIPETTTLKFLFSPLIAWPLITLVASLIPRYFHSPFTRQSIRPCAV